jgi:prepilin-type N-terminal cleavage/methylation domain-containing protein
VHLNTYKLSQKGYNLVEVLIAIAILGTILLSIITLFFMGRSQVYSGKMMTQAVAIGTDALEDLSGMTVQGVYDTFLIDGATALDDYVVEGVEYENCLIRSTDPNIVASPPGDLQDENVPATGTGLLTSWNDDITNNRKMADGSVTVILRPRMPTTVGTASAPAPRVLQMRVIVRWRESTRERRVVFDTVRYRR